MSKVLGLCLTIGLLVGCGNTTLNKQYTLEDIAKLNGLSVSELNVGYDSDGHINFIGNTFTKDKIRDAKSATKALNKVRTLLCLDEVSLELIRTDVSPSTKATYYTYSQVVSTKQNSGNDMELFGNGIVKVIADKDGNAAGISLYIQHGELMEFDSSRMFTKEEAEQMVKDLYEDAHIYSEATKCIYWSDDAVASYVGSEGSIVPVWVVFIDAPSKENGLSMDIAEGATLTDESIECCPYLELIIPAVRAEGSNGNAIVASYYTSNIENTNDLTGTYASMEFFDSKEDAGFFTLEMDLSTWVPAAFPDYKGEMTSTVTVPVMYDKKLELYVLGDKNELLTAGNMYDFIKDDVYNVNPLVTKTPETVDSWHFLNDGNDKIGRAYFCNPNYVIASFNAYRKVYMAYKEQFGLNSYDTSGLPLLLLTYGCGDEYPEDEQSFIFNAANGGQRADWGAFMTSPILAECLGMATMFHEYTHGINGCLTKAHYLNEAGAVMEGLADILGIQMAQKYAGKAEDNWDVGGDFYYVVRDPANPRNFHNPQVIDDVYYISATEPIFDDLSDCGGVHNNSGVLNFYAYRLREPGVLADNESALTLDESINLWYECLFMSNYETGFSEIARYNMLAAKLLKLSEDKLRMMDRIIDENGLINREPAKELFYNGAEKYTMSFEYENPSMDSDWSFMAFAVTDGAQYNFGGDINNVINGSIPDKSDLLWVLFAGDKASGQVTKLSPTVKFSNQNISVTVKNKVSAKIGNTCTAPEGEKIVMYNSEQTDFASSLVHNKESAFNKSGNYVFMTTPVDSDNIDTMFMYVYEVTAN